MENEEQEKSVEEILAEEEKETPKNQEETTTPEKVQEEKPDKSKEFQSLDAQKRYYREKAEKLEKELAGLKSKSFESNVTLDAIMVGKKLEKYSDDEIYAVAKVIKSDKPGDILAALENPYVKKGIEVDRKEKADLNKVPGSSSPDFASREKSWEEIKKFGLDEKGKAEFRKYAQEQERGGGRTGI